MPPVAAERKPELIGLREASAEFGVSMPTLYRWLASGRLAGHRRPVGRTRTFVDRRQLRELLEPKRSARKRK
jgi:excisionase family DNA binding protein